MPLAFPLTRTIFLNQLPVSNLIFDLPEVVSHSRTRGGEVLSADIGDRLWRGEITLGQITRSEYAEVRPIINLLRGGGTFLIHDLARPFPRNDPAGTQLALSTPTIAALPNALELTVSGLPAGYVISRDDMIGWRYGPAPRRYALHQVVTGGAANASGLTPAIQVVPPIAHGTILGEPVVLVRPACKALIDPGSTTPARGRATIHDGATFKFCQTHG